MCMYAYIPSISGRRSTVVGLQPDIEGCIVSAHHVKPIGGGDLSFLMLCQERLHN